MANTKSDPKIHINSFVLQEANKINQKRSELEIQQKILSLIEILYSESPSYICLMSRSSFDRIVLLKKDNELFFSRFRELIQKLYHIKYATDQITCENAKNNTKTSKKAESKVKQTFIKLIKALKRDPCVLDIGTDLGTEEKDYFSIMSNPSNDNKFYTMIVEFIKNYYIYTYDSDRITSAHGGGES